MKKIQQTICHSEAKPKNLMRSFTTFRMTIIICSIFYFLFSLPKVSSAALLYSAAANQVVYQDQTFVVDWYLDTQGVSINSTNAILHFSPETLQAVSADAGGSEINLWIKPPEFDNTAGTISFTGGIAGGANASKFNVIRTTFKAKALGSAKIYLDDSSQVSLNDGKGTFLKLSFAPLSFPVVAKIAAGPLVQSATNQDETAWYKNNNVEIQVAPQAGEIYSFSFSSNQDMIPDDKADDVTQKLTFSNLPDGIYYFKLNSKIGNANWQESIVRRFQIDATAPGQFTPVATSDPGIFNGSQFVSFATTDATSGIDHYEVRVGFIGPWTKTNSTYFVLPQLHLSNQIFIKAVDVAGNERLAQTEYNQSNNGSNFRKWLFWIIIIITGLLGIWLIRWVVKKTRKVIG